MTRKTPDNVKSIRGTKQPCRTVGETVEFDLVDAIPPAPEYLDVIAATFWRRIVPVLVDKRLLTLADLESLEVMCALYGKVRKCIEANVDINAATVTQLRLYQTEFGLTPASRTKMKAADNGKKGNKFTNRSKKKA